MMGVFVQLNEGMRAQFGPVGYIIQENGCWDWVGANNGAGYGVFYPPDSPKKRWYAHRWTYAQAKGPIPAGLTIDHLCRNPSCCNPDHLEAVTHRENVLRGSNAMVAVHRSGVCQRGHHIRGKNAFWKKDGHKQCRECLRISWRKKAASLRKWQDVVSREDVGGDAATAMHYTLQCGHVVKRRRRTATPAFRHLPCSECSPGIHCGV